MPGPFCLQKTAAEKARRSFVRFPAYLLSYRVKGILDREVAW